MVVEFVGLAHGLLALGLLALIQPDDALEYYFSVKVEETLVLLLLLEDHYLMEEY